MAIEIFGNNATTTLASGIGSGAVSCTLLTGTGALFPNPSAGQFFRMTFQDAATNNTREIVFVTARSGDVCTITRAQESTTAVAWITGDYANNLPTAGAMAGMSQQQQVQQNTLNYATDTGAANAYVISLPSPGLAAPVPGAVIYWIAANTNSGPSTITVNGSSAYPLLGGARTALQAGEILKFCSMTYDAATSSYLLLYSGGAEQVATATQTKHAVNLGQADARYAALAGNAGQSFAASQIITASIKSPSAGQPTFLQSDAYNASVNAANNQYQQMYVGQAVNGLAAVNLSLADGRYAAINGTYAQTFQAANYYLNGGSIIQFNGGLLVVQANAGLYCVNIANNTFTPVTCGPATNAQQATTLNQFTPPLIGYNNIYATNTTTSTTVSFFVPKAGVLYASGSIVYSVQQTDGGTNTGSLSINGVVVGTDTTPGTKAHMGAAYTGSGVVSATYTGAAGPAFSLHVALIYVPNVG